jgi:acetolactate synthase-1/2/3 large subunit
MAEPITRRSALKAAAAATALAVLPPLPAPAPAAPGCVSAKLTGAAALVESLKAEGVDVVFGIPGAQENELWDEMKSRCLAYLLVTHEYSASCMADGYARSTGRPGVICIVPGPGVTNALTGIGEALLDSVPMVCVVGDVARGDKYKPFQVHDLPNVELLKPVTKLVIAVAQVCEIPGAVRQAFETAVSGEPGPVAVVVPYNLLIECAHVSCCPHGPPALPFDEAAFLQALALLSGGCRKGNPLRIGIYAGMGCMDYSVPLTQVAELLQAPVATSVSGKGVIDECHPLAVGWGYGPQGTVTAEQAFKRVDLVLAIGVRCSEVSTGFYSLPQTPYVIQVDANPHNLGRVLHTSVCVHADAGVFLHHLLEHADEVRRPPDGQLVECIRQWKAQEAETNARNYGVCGVDPLLLYLAIRRAACPEALVFVDVSMSEHWAAEVFTTYKPRTYFNPTDNQAMGWTIPASIGAQRGNPGRLTIAIAGDGCFLMTAVEMSTAARECLPVKFFILDDGAYHYMQTLQKQAYKRSTATFLAHLDYPALAKAFGLAYVDVPTLHDLDSGIKAALEHPGPVLVRVGVDYGKRPLRWLGATKKRYTKELSAGQKMRFLARLGSRSLDHHPHND